MSKRNKSGRRASEITRLGLIDGGPSPDAEMVEAAKPVNRLWLVGGIALVLTLVVGVFAANGWFPRTDGLSGKRSGWFGAEVAKNSASCLWSEKREKRSFYRF
ncbi:MAG: hypothetical protein WKF34_07285 [Pyrinomonadaceae bacterium]